MSFGSPESPNVDSGVDADHKVVMPSNMEKHATSQVDSDISDSTPLATTVETIVDQSSDQNPSVPASVELIVQMPKLTNLDNLPLHSPSSQTLGTPFAVDDTRFEYPFPETNQACGSGSSSATSALSNSPTSSAFSSSNPFPTLSKPLQVLTQLSFPPPSHHPSYNATHPKMKVQANPPIPPNLVKRRLRWSLNLLGRRKSSTGSQQSGTTSDESTMPDTTDAQQAASPPGSPIQERVIKR